MKFSSFKEFRDAVLSDLPSVIKYLSVDMTKIIRELQVGLTRLKFTDNFESFKTTVNIPAGAEVSIRNELRSGLVPTERIILRGGTGTEDVVDGDSTWNNNFVYLKNNGASTAIVTVLFLR